MSVSPALAVTTRSHLRRVHQFVPMLISSMRIRRQLAHTDGCLRFASIIAGPREFWTITVWETRDKMLDFMRSGAHEDIMWLFGKWLDSFWLTRWIPTEDEYGSWSGLSLSPATSQTQAPERGEAEQKALEAALDAIPQLRASVGPSGAPDYEHSPFVRRRRKMVQGGVGATVRIKVPHLWQVPAAWRDLAGMRRRMLDHADVLRWAVGISRPRELYALAVLRNHDIAERFLSSRGTQALRERWGDGFWAMRWDPTNEFGHWDGLRLRSERLGTAIRVPEDAARAADYDPDRARRRRREQARSTDEKDS